MATYYVATSGLDSNPGTQASPFRTIYKACTAATLFGDNIIIGPGTFSESNICSVRTGVSITGAGKESTTITSTYNLYPLFNLVSSTEGTNGSQTLSNFKIDGNEIIRSAIYVYKRSNVKILYVDIIDCTANGIRFLGGGTYAGGWDGNAGTPPVTFETGNEIAYCNITDCSDGSLNNHANITIGSQDGILIHDCIFTQKGNPDGQNADILSGWGTHFKNLKFYNNKSYKNVVQKLGWNFHIEIGCTWGGNEVYNNEFYNGTIFDIGAWFNVKGDEDYAWNIHHNIMITERQVSTTEKTTSWGVVFEGTNEDCWFHHNYVKNFQNPVAQTLNQTPRHQNNIRVYNNIFEDIGTSNNHWGWFATITTELLNENDEIIAGDMPITNSYYYNNTMIGKLAQGGVIVSSSSDDITGIYISNNIIKSTIGYGWLTIWHSNDLFGSINDLYVRNNDIYDNTNNNAIYYNNSSSINNLVQTDNIHVDPLFISSTDFHLQSNSTLIDAGIDVGLVSDYDGISIPQGSAPDIGAYEYEVEGPGELTYVEIVRAKIHKFSVL